MNEAVITSAIVYTTSPTYAYGILICKHCVQVMIFEYKYYGSKWIFKLVYNSLEFHVFLYYLGWIICLCGCVSSSHLKEGILTVQHGDHF